jgi:hypothetical protein
MIPIRMCIAPVDEQDIDPAELFGNAAGEAFQIG